MPLNAVKLQISRARDMVCVYKRKNLGESPSARHVTIPYFPDWIVSLKKKKTKKKKNLITSSFSVRWKYHTLSCQRVMMIDSCSASEENTKRHMTNGIRGVKLTNSWNRRHVAALHSCILVFFFWNLKVKDMTCNKYAANTLCCKQIVEIELNWRLIPSLNYYPSLPVVGEKMEKNTKSSTRWRY